MVLKVNNLPINLESTKRGISKNPLICGGDACIDGTRIPVWCLVESRNLGISESQILDDYPHLQLADLVNAWFYAKTHAEEIEMAIAKNQEI